MHRDRLEVQMNPLDRPPAAAPDTAAQRAQSIVPAAVNPARIGVVLLAAGRSERMGGPNKLLMRIDGEPLVRRMLRTLQAVPIGHIVVVLGRDAQAVRVVLDALPVRAFCRAPEGSDQQVSVDAGLRALPAGLDAILIALADQPLLDAGDLRWMIDRWSGLPRGSALVPVFEGRRGNPVIIDGSMREPVLAAGPAIGCRGYLEANRGQVHRVEAPNDHFVIDVDTARDIDELAARGVLLEPPRAGRG